MPFDLRDYGSSIIIASGDFRAELSSQNTPVGPGNHDALFAQPTFLGDVAASFLDAGADVLIAPTDEYSGEPGPTAMPAHGETAGKQSVESHEDIGLDSRALRITSVMAAVRQAATQWATRRIPVLGAIGPPDRLLMLEETDDAELRELFTMQAGALAASGADGVLCRSFTELETLVLAVNAVREATSLPVIASMTFDSGEDFARTVLGVTIPQACAALSECGVMMVGCNGSEYPDGAPAIATLLRESSKAPVFLEINAGRAELLDEGIRYTEAPDVFGERMHSLMKAGVRLLGGGRGVTAAHVERLVSAAARATRRKSHKPLD